MPPHIPPATERRIRREARSATLRERALALRMAGWTYPAIGRALGFSATRALQIVRKAQCTNQKGAPSQERLSVSTGPFTAGQVMQATPWYDPPTS
jgi:hypothetical protein